MVQTCANCLKTANPESLIKKVVSNQMLQPCCNGPEGTNVSQQSNDTHPTQGSGQAHETHDSQIAAVHLLPGFSSNLIDRLQSLERPWTRTMYRTTCWDLWQWSVLHFTVRTYGICGVCVCVFIFLPCLPPLRQNLNLHRVLIYTAPSLTEW